MPRIIALDYGAKRTGIAVTDPLKIIASALTTVETKNLFIFLTNYFATEQVEALVIGFPTHLDGNDTHSTPLIRTFISQCKEKFPDLPIHLMDERFTSKLAVQAMIAGGMKKKDRQIKGNVDQISAVIILQDFMRNPTPTC